MSDQTTPRPWKVEKLKNDQIFFGIDDRPTWVARVEMQASKDQEQANAELIVKAVNRDALFEELVEACEQHLKDYAKEQWNQVGGDEYQLKLEDLLKRAKAAK